MAKSLQSLHFLPYFLFFTFYIVKNSYLSRIFCYKDKINECLYASVSDEIVLYIFYQAL